MAEVDVVVEERAPMLAYLAAPADVSARRPAIIVAHELFGVNADIRGVVDQLAQQGYIAVAPEFYHRQARAGEALPRDQDGRRRGFEYLHALSRESVIADVLATMRHLVQRADHDGKTGMLGFSAGGHMAFLAATQLDLVATVVLYGGWLTGGDVAIAKPEPTLALAQGIAEHRGRLLYIVGGKDAIIDATQIEKIESALREASVGYELVVYPEAQHAFFWEGAPSFDRSARDDAWSRLTAFFANAFARVD